CDDSFGTLDKRVVGRDQHERSGVATRGNDEAVGEHRIINAGGCRSGIAQVNTQVVVGWAAAADDETRISAEGVWRTEFWRLRVLQRKCLEAHDREHWRINRDIHRR